MTTQEQQPAQPAHPPASRPATLAASAEPVAFYKDGVLFWHGEHAAWRGKDGELYAGPPAPSERAPAGDERADTVNSDPLPVVARLYYSGSPQRRYRRASTRTGPGEPLCFVSVAEAWLRRKDALIAALEKELAAALASAPVACDHQFHFFGDQKERRCNRCCVLESKASDPVAGEAQPVAYLYHDAASLGELLSNERASLFVNSVFISLNRQPHYRNEIQLYAAPQASPAADGRDAKGLRKANVHLVKLKSRKEMKATIPRDHLGWWHDVCPGQRMTLRDATAQDLARCTLNGNRSKNPNDYLCELPDTGSLISKAAIKHCATYVIDSTIAAQHC